MFKRKQSIRRISPKKLEKKKLENEKTKELHEWFLTLWDKRENEQGYCICFETSCRLSRSYRGNTCCYSHLLPKSKYPQYAMEEWNVVIVHPDAHSQFEVYPSKAPKQNQLKKDLLEKHEKNS